MGSQAKQQQSVQKEPSDGMQARQSRPSGKNPQRRRATGQKIIGEHGDKFSFATQRSQSDLDAAAVNSWASESLVDDLDLDDTAGGNLLDWEDEQAISGEAAVSAADVASPEKAAGERAEGQPKKKSALPRVYTAQRLKEL